MKKLFSNKELKDFLWQTMIDTETGANKLKGMFASQNRGRTQDRLFRPQCRRYENCQIMMPASLSFPTEYYIAAFVMDSYETDEDNANIIARISRMVYDAMR